MDYQVKKLVQANIESVVDLFVEKYVKEKEQSILLPSGIVKDPRRIGKDLASRIKNPCVGAFKDNKLIAYMITGDFFDFKGQKAVIVPVHCHGLLDKDKVRLYQMMYMALSSDWIKHGVHLHIIGHFAHDSILEETVFQLGFGAILAEKLRDLSLPALEVECNYEIKQENDFRKLADIQLEHNKYYPQAPIFIKKTTDRDEIIKELEEFGKEGDVYFSYYKGDVLSGYFVVGESAKDGEGFLLRNTNTAQVKSAFIKPDIRSKGIGLYLLRESIKWAKENGFERLFVEHETANFYGGNFWNKHFESYLYFSMRYIDSSI